MIKAYKVPVGQVMSVRSLTLLAAQKIQIWNALSDKEPGQYIRDQAFSVMHALLSLVDQGAG